MLKVKKIIRHPNFFLYLGPIVLAIFLLIYHIPHFIRAYQQKPPEKIVRQTEFSPYALPQVRTAQATTTYSNLKLLIIVTENYDQFSLNQDHLSRVDKAINLTREFFWRNSNMKLNLETEKQKLNNLSRAILSNSQVNMSELEAELRKKHVNFDNFDLLFIIFPYDKVFLSSNQKFSLFKKNIVSLSAYQESDKAYPHGPSFTWYVLKTLWSSVERGVYKQTPTDPKDYADLAQIMRPFYFWELPKPYGTVYETTDNDADGVPDDDQMVVFDEKRFNASYQSLDSDGDGMKDTHEILCGIFRGCDLRNGDTDKDRFNDGKDSHPLDYIISSLKKFTSDKKGEPPLFVSQLHFSSDPEFKVETYASYDEKNYYFVFEMNKKAKVYLWLDGEEAADETNELVKRITIPFEAQEGMKKEKFELKVDFKDIGEDEKSWASLFEPYVREKISLEH